MMNNILEGIIDRNAGAHLKSPRVSQSRYSVLRNDRAPQTILIHGSPFLISMDEHDQLMIRQHVSILLHDGIIQEVFDASDRSKVPLDSVDLIYDAEQRGGVIVTPGFINAHAHPPMYLLRSALAFEEVDLNTALDQMARLEQHMTPDDFLLGAVGDFTEEQRWGVTTVLSHYGVFDPIEEASRVTKETVINALSAVSNSHPENTPALVESYLKRRMSFTTTPAIALHYLYKASPTILSEIAELMRKYDVVLTLHSAETRVSVAECVRVHGDTPVNVLDRYGILGPRTIISHGVYLTEDEVSLIKKRQAGVVHLPTSNLLHRSGTFNYPLFKKLDATRHIALGTDSIISKNRLDLLSEALQAKTLHQEMSNVSYAELFSMITSQAANIVGLKRIGRILPGYRADLAFWKMKDRGFLPFDEDDPTTLVSNMITHGGHNVRDLMIGGKFVISNRMNNLIHEGILLERLHEAHRNLRQRIKSIS